MDLLTFKVPKLKIHVAEYANIIDPDEAAHNELPHQNLHCLPAGSILFEFSV